MRFKRIETRRKGLQSVAGKPLSADETQETSASAGKERQRAALPIEWEPLKPLIETERARRPAKEYLEEFPSRMTERLRQSLQAEEAVRHYTRRTAGWRWTLRAATALSIALLLAFVQFQQREIREMRGRVTNLEEQVRVLEASL